MSDKEATADCSAPRISRRQMLSALACALPVAAMADAQLTPANASGVLTVNDLKWHGLLGTPFTGIRGNDFNYSRGPFALRYVGGQRRAIIAARGAAPAGDLQKWPARDLFELAIPSSYSQSTPTPGKPLDVVAPLAPGRRWPAATWQNLGAMEGDNGIVLG